MNGPDCTEPVAPEPGPDGERSRWWLSPRLLVIAALVPAVVLLGLLGWAITKPVTTSSGGSNTVFSDFDLEGREAPNFSLQGLDGATVQLADSRGKVVMVDFWASWCPSCRQEAPHLVELYEEYRGRGVEFIGVAIWDFPDDLNTYVEQFGLIYPNALDEKGTVAIEYGVVATPEKFFIDRDGNIVRKFVGPTSPELLRHQLDELLES